ncbi:MAG: Smr/MutS family protein [Gemmatimonadaceae bacterium]
MTTYRRRQFTAVRQALDEVRFGPGRTLNLRASLPTAADASARAEAWLRQKQVEGAREVLVITGRGNQSPDGHSVVREAVRRALAALRRRGVVATVAEHTPGSFVVTLASMRALSDAPRRKRERGNPPAAELRTLGGLQPATVRLLRDLAEHSLAALGVRDTARHIESEMLRQFDLIMPGVSGTSRNKEQQLCRAIERAIEEHDSA